MQPTADPAPHQLFLHPLDPTPPSTPAGGRRRILTPSKCHEICTLVAAGCGIDGAARHIGCVPKTIHREARRNPQFGSALRQALTTAELQPLSAIREAASRHWRAAAWLLERTNPRQFARHDPDAIQLDEFRVLVKKIELEIVGFIQVHEKYMPLLRKLRALVENALRDARIRQELPAFNPRRLPPPASRPATPPILE